MSRGKPSRGVPRCNKCKAPAKWARSPFSNAFRLFNARPVDLSTQHPAAYPIEGNQAWRQEDLVVELMGRWGIGTDDAREHVHAMPWHTFHSCDPIGDPPDPDDTSSTTSPGEP